MANIFKGLAGIVVVAGIVAGIVGLFMVYFGRLPYFPWLFTSGALAMFCTYALLVIVFAHAVITTSKQDPV